MGPPNDVGRLDTMVAYIYRAIMGQTKQYGRASAAAILLFLIIFAVTLVNLQVSKKKTQY
jgi:ABC-type sugar transport system permease subunit